MKQCGINDKREYYELWQRKILDRSLMPEKPSHYYKIRTEHAYSPRGKWDRKGNYVEFSKEFQRKRRLQHKKDYYYSKQGQATLKEYKESGRMKEVQDTHKATKKFKDTARKYKQSDKYKHYLQTKGKESRKRFYELNRDRINARKRELRRLASKRTK